MKEIVNEVEEGKRVLRGELMTMSIVLRIRREWVYSAERIRRETG